MDLFQYIDSIMCIKYLVQEHFTNSSFTTSLMNMSLEQVHAQIARYAHTNPRLNVVLVFDNDVQLMKNLTGSDINLLVNNECKSFMTTNTDWDLIVIDDLPDASAYNPTLVDGYNYVFKLDNSIRFPNVYQFPYIMSRRFINKVVANDMTSLNVYYYQPAILRRFKPFSLPNPIYTIGVITRLYMLTSSTLKYKWIPCQLS